MHKSSIMNIMQNLIWHELKTILNPLLDSTTTTTMMIMTMKMKMFQHESHSYGFRQTDN